MPQKLTKLATSLGVRRQKGVRVEGHGNMLIHFAGCCRPVPGDRIVGVITRGRGVSIHRHDCVNISGGRIPEERRVRVEWNALPAEQGTPRLFMAGWNVGRVEVG